MSNIVALATPHGKGAIHIIRFSGPDVFNIINKIVLNPVKKTIDRVEINYLITKKKEIIDQVVLIKFSGPHSYTGEDLIEINTHGNNLIVSLIIKELISYGATPALPGEFTKRALLNNKITVNEVESIKNLFSAKTALDIYHASEEITGKTSKIIDKLQSDFFNLISEIEINIDYPPEIEDKKNNLELKFQQKLFPFQQKLSEIYKPSNVKKPSNYRVLLLGQPNAGKSSLLNYLLKEEKIIVSNIAGTTRDIIEVEYIYQDYLLTLVDSAGIRKTKDILEQKSIKKTTEEITKADLIIYLKDSASINIEDDEILKLLKNKKFFTLHTKKDLLSAPPTYPCISVKNSDLNSLYSLLDEYLQNNYFPSGINNEYINNNIYKSMEELKHCFNINITIDLMVEHIIKAREYLLNCLSIQETNTDRINKIFDNFCIGK